MEDQSETTDMDEASKNQKTICTPPNYEISCNCVNACCLCSSTCSFCQDDWTKDFIVKSRCECLLLLADGEVYSAETKMCYVESSMKRVLETCTVSGQMKALLEATLPKVTKA